MVSRRSTLKHGEELNLACRPRRCQFSAREKGTFADNRIENSVVAFPKFGFQFFITSVEILASVWGLKQTLVWALERAVVAGDLPF